MYPMRSVANATTENERLARDETPDDPLPLVGDGRGIPFVPVKVAVTTPPEPV